MPTGSRWLNGGCAILLLNPTASLGRSSVGDVDLRNRRGPVAIPVWDRREAGERKSMKTRTFADRWRLGSTAHVSCARTGRNASMPVGFFRIGGLPTMNVGNSEMPRPPSTDCQRASSSFNRRFPANGYHDLLVTSAKAIENPDWRGCRRDSYAGRGRAASQAPVPLEMFRRGANHAIDRRERA